jgi:Methyltransferase domain
MDGLIQIYNSIHLNTGSKRLLNKYIFSYRNLCWIDECLLFPVYRLLEKYFYQRIVYHYGADYRWGDEKSQDLNKRTFNYGYGLSHYSFVRSQRPKQILCIGSMYGFIPYMLAKACMENGDGHVDFVDAGYDKNDPNDKEKHIYGQGFWKKPEAKKHFSFLLNPKYISLHVMTTQQFAKKIPKKRYDYIYLDGDHRYTGANFDFQTFWPRLNEGGFMTLHDIHFDTTCGGITFEQWRLWEKLVQQYPYKIELYNHYSGLGIIQKRTKRPQRFRGKVPE